MEFELEKTIVKSYIFKRLKFRTDLHTHMNANLSPDALIALGIKHQIQHYTQDGLRIHIQYHSMRMEDLVDKGQM